MHIFGQWRKLEKIHTNTGRPGRCCPPLRLAAHHSVLLPPLRPAAAVTPTLQFWFLQESMYVNNKLVSDRQTSFINPLFFLNVQMRICITEMRCIQDQPNYYDYYFYFTRNLTVHTFSVTMFKKMSNHTDYGQSRISLCQIHKKRYSLCALDISVCIYIFLGGFINRSTCLISKRNAKLK